MSFEIEPGVSGVLPAQWIERAIESGYVRTPKRTPIPPRNVQPASLDLRLGTKAYRIQASFLPDREAVETKLQDYVLEEFDITEGAVLEPDCPYLIPLVEALALPDNVKARANPKSSTGRLDIFTRVISDRSLFFDDIRPGYRGPLFLEVVSRTFTVRVKAGLCLNQLRLVVGGAAGRGRRGPPQPGVVHRAGLGARQPGAGPVGRTLPEPRARG